jgi:hypothetical protein
LFTQRDFKVWINGEMFRLRRPIFQGERIKNADVFALFPPAIRFFSGVAEIVGLNRVSLEQAVLCSDGLYYSGTKGGQNAGGDAGSLCNFEQFSVPRY